MKRPDIEAIRAKNDFFSDSYRASLTYGMTVLMQRDIPLVCNYAIHLEGEIQKLRALLHDKGLDETNPNEWTGIPNQFGGPL